MGDGGEKKMAEQDPETDWSGWRLDLPLLPSNALQAIAEYLEVRDVLCCMTVCRGWFELFRYGGGFGAFWRRTYLFMGLPAAYVQEHISRYEFPSDLYVEIVRHRDHVMSIAPEIKVLTGIHPFDSSTKCEHAGEGYFVKTVDFCSLDHEETVIGQLCPERRVILKIDSLAGAYGEVRWANICAGNVVWHTNKELWFKYNLQNATFHKLFPGVKIARSTGDSIGHCRHCLFFVVAGAENAMHSYSWHLHFVKVEGEEEEEEEGEKRRVLEYQCKVPIPSNVTQFIPKPVRAHITSNDGCLSHRLLLQGGSGTCVYGIQHHPPMGISLSREPLGMLNPFYDTGVAVMVANTTSRITLSQDNQLAAIVTSVVYPFTSGLCLHIFDLSSYERIISVKVDWREHYDDAEILTFSGLYTILGVPHSRGGVKVVQSRTGKVLLEKSEICCGLPPTIPLARLLCCHYQGVYGEECLHDIFSPLTLAVLFRRGVANIQGLFFDPFPKPPDAERPSLEELDDSDDADREM